MHLDLKSNYTNFVDFTWYVIAFSKLVSRLIRKERHSLFFNIVLCWPYVCSWPKFIVPLYDNTLSFTFAYESHYDISNIIYK